LFEPILIIPLWVELEVFESWECGNILVSRVFTNPKVILFTHPITHPLKGERTSQLDKFVGNNFLGARQAPL
jgi:hypothetical protein